MSANSKTTTHRLACSLGLLLCLTGVLHAQPPTKPDAPLRENSHRWAILIGVDDYAQLNDLQFCGADQTALREQLIAAGFPDQQIFLLHDKAEDKKYQPFKANIEKQLALVLGLVEKGDTVIVAFSGHGVQSGNTPFLCPTEAVLDDPASMVSLDWVYEQLQDCPATLRLLLVDACRNDPRLGSPRSTTPSDATKQLARSLEKPPPEGILLLTSCSAGEISMEEKAFGHGVFMHYLLEGLQGAADADENGRVSLEELSNFAGSETKLYVARNFNESQRPKLRGDLTIDALGFELSLVPRRSMVGMRAGEERDDNELKMKFCWCPQGTFMMGSPTGEMGRSENEDQVQVTLSRGFWMGKYEVTQQEWHQVMGTTIKEQKEKARFGSDRGQGVRHPMCFVNQDDVTEFCRLFTERERAAGRLVKDTEYRLPAEAEWEYACRAGTTTTFSFGDTFGIRQANCFGSSSPESEKKTFGNHDLMEVGSFDANRWGLCDMHGNVAERCLDTWLNSLSGGTNPVSVSNSTEHMALGGAFGDYDFFCRSASRQDAAGGWSGSYRISDASRIEPVGFRVCLSNSRQGL